MKRAFPRNGVFGLKERPEIAWPGSLSTPLRENEAAHDGSFLKSYSAKLSEIAGSLHFSSEVSAARTSEEGGVSCVPVPIPRQSKTKRFSMTYVALIASAILRFPQKRLTLSQIYQVIERMFPDFTASRAGWKNTVRHNLSLHDCFVKGDVAANGKSCYWHIHPAYVARFSRGDFRKRPSRDMCMLEARRDFKCVRLEAKHPYPMPPLFATAPSRHEHLSVGGNCTITKPFGLPSARTPQNLDKGTYPSTEWLNEYKPYPYFYLFSPRQASMKPPQTQEFFRGDKRPNYYHNC